MTDFKNLWTITVGSLLVACTIWLVAGLFDDRRWKQEQLAELESIWADYQRLQRAEFPSTVWADFQAATESDLQQRTRDLLAASDEDDQTIIDLFRLSRDFLPRVVLTKNSKDNFARQCEGLIDRVGEQLVASASANRGSLGPIETAVLLIDGVLILLIGRWWIGR